MFCKEPLSNEQPTAKMYQKGSDSTNQSSQARHDTIRVSPGQAVHQECRRVYSSVFESERSNRENVTNKENILGSPRALRSQSEFIFSDLCLFCDQTAKLSGKIRRV